MSKYIPTYLSYKQLMNLFPDENISFDKMLHLCRIDPFLSLRTIEVADSIFKNSSSEGSVHTLSDSLEIIGSDNLKFFLLSNLKLTEHISKFSAEFPFETLWRHSVVTALIAEGISEFLFETEHLDKDKLYVVSLLHDIGKIVLFLQSPDDFVLIMDELMSGEKSLADIESEETSHTLLLKNYLSELKFPEGLIAISSKHHEPSQIESHIISVADFSAHAAGFSVIEGEKPPKLNDITLKEINISPERLKVITNDALNKYYSIEEDKKLFSKLE